jgi:hypothetical protein
MNAIILKECKGFEGLKDEVLIYLIKNETKKIMIFFPGSLKFLI